MKPENIHKINQQYKLLTDSRNKMDYYLSTTEDGSSWTFRMVHKDVDYLKERGAEWVRLRTCKDWQVTPFKVGFQ